MNRRVIIARNPLEPDAYETFHDVTDVRELLMDQFTSWPDSARVYHNYVSQVTDVTPHDELTINRLEELDGDIIVVVYPEGFIAIIVALVVVVALVAVVALAKPSIPDVSAQQRNQQASSPNNELSARTNRERINARIPDIYGTVRSTPDLIAPPYKVYESNQEVEIAYMCVGRGEYQIHDIRDGDTLMSQIPGSSAAVYGPNTSPNSGSAVYTVGNLINEPLRRAKRAEQIVGQELRAPNRQKASNPGQFKFQYPDRIYNSNGYILSDKFNAGDGIVLAGATFTGTSGDVSTTQAARYVKTTSTTRYPYSGRDIFTIGPSGAAWLEFYNEGEPIERGFDIEIPGPITLYDTTWTNYFNGTYTITTPVASNATQLRVQDDFELLLKDWDRINGWTDYFTCTIGGVNRSARFHYSGIIELQSGNWNDLIGDTHVTLSLNCQQSYNVNGTYSLSTRSTSLNRWYLTNPASVNANWDAVRGGHEPAVNGYITQVRSNPDDYYVEWTGDDPRNYFEVGDTLQISSASYVCTYKPINIRYPETGTDQVDLKQTGLAFLNGQEPVEAGFDLRANKDFVLTGASWTNYFNGTYTITSPVTSGDTLLRVQDAYKLSLKDWHRINGWTDYFTCTIGGLSRVVRFHYLGLIELQAGNWDDLIGASSVVLSADCRVRYSVNGTYRYSSRNTTNDTWTLVSPTAVDVDWNAIRAGHEPAANIIITQVHSTDTSTLVFNGTYQISALTADRIYMTSPGGLGSVAVVTSDWDRLAEFINTRTDYSTDIFFVNNPTRSISLNGTYEIASVSTYEIILANPGAVTRDWHQLRFFSSQQVTPANATITGNGNNWIGPFFLDNPNMTHVYCNFIAENGLYKDDGTDQFRGKVELDILMYGANENGSAISTTVIPSQTASIALTGSAVNRNTVAATRKIGLVDPGRKLIYARRVTAEDTAFTGQVVDEVKWKDVYMIESETRAHFGNVTTVQTQTYATNGALALKERKFNMMVSRKIPIITSWTGTYPNMTPVYAADKAATRNAAQIFCALAVDPFFGNRPIADIDTYNIFQSLNMVYDYFGATTYDVTEFCYTFDNTNASFEEAAQAIANAVFCTAYRQGSTLKWKPEIGGQQPVLIFNHRNKLPDTESRTVRFGSQNDFDSVQLEWVNPKDDAIETFFIPEDQSGSTPKKVETIGIRNITQATYHAWRSFYKTKFQNVAVEFQSTQEAGVLIQKDKVLVADNTRADTQDGEVINQDVLQLTLSQEVTLAAGKTYTIFLQHVDGSVEGIPISAVPDNITLVRNVYLLKDGGVRFPVVAEAGLFSPGDVVRLISTSFVDPVNGSLSMDKTGYIVESIDPFSGIVRFSNGLALDADWGKITAAGGHLRVGVNFISERSNKRKVNLAYAPRNPLALDPQNYARTTYVIRSNTEVAPQAFMVQETRPKDNFVYSVSLVNFDARFYYLDDLEFWLNFDDQTFRDASARGHVVYISTAPGKAQIAYNSQRGSYVFYNQTNSTAAWVKCDDLISHRGSYTKSFWLRQGAGFDSYFLSNSYEQFRVNNTGRIIAGHSASGTSLTALSSVTWPSSDGQWHHACLTYDAATKILTAYVDGVKVAVKTAVNPPSTAAALQPIGLGSSGVANPYADDVRYWRRCFSEQEVAELYVATK